MSGNLNDPYEAASAAKLAPRTYYGKIELDVWFCALVKGQGKAPYDPLQHRLEQRRTVVHLTIVPLAEMNLSYVPGREMIAESKEWAGTVWPSLKALGITNLREAQGKWCQVQMVGTGRRYTGSDGAEREATTFRFVALYANEEECRKAYLGSHGNDVPEVTPEETTGNAPIQPENPTERTAALEFVKALAKQCAGDRDLLAKRIAATPLISKYFTVNSPEVQALL